MKILLTNDDGIYAPGLWALYKQFAHKHKVTVVAPDRERSAVSHGITLNEPVRTHKVSINCNGYEGYAVSGKPADCVKLGLQEIVKQKPDLLVSGINPGANVGVNINYSGTVAAAKEAALYGIPAIAVSIEGHNAAAIYDDSAKFTKKLAQNVIENGLPFGTFLNVNMPNLPMKDMEGIRVSRQGICKLPEDYYERRIDPRNRPYHWLGLEPINYGNDLNIDGDALAQKYITITPIKCDMTDYDTLEKLKLWRF